MEKDFVTEENEEQGGPVYISGVYSVPVYISGVYSVFIFHGTRLLNSASSLIAHLEG